MKDVPVRTATMEPFAPTPPIDFAPARGQPCHLLAHRVTRRLASQRSIARVPTGIMLLAWLSLAAASAAEPVVITGHRPTCDQCATSDATQVEVDPDAPAATASLESVTHTITNLHIEAGGAGSFGNLFNYRGLSNTPYFSDPAVTVYLDDIPLAGTFTLPTRLIGTDSATLWRGSTASAFGRAGEAGTLILRSDNLRNEARLDSGNYDTQAGEVTLPGAQPEGDLRVDGGNFDSRTLSASFHSTTATLDTQIAAAAGARNGYIRNILLNKDVDDQRTADVSARLTWSGTDSARFTLQGLATRERDGAQSLVPLNGALFTVSRTRDGSTDIDTRGIALKGAFDMALGMLTSTTSHTTYSLDPYDNRLVLPPPLDSRLTQGQRAWNEELKLTPSSPTPLTSPSSRSSGTVESIRPNVGVWSLGAWFSDVRTQGYADRAIVGLFPIELSHFEIHARTNALFGELRHRFTDRWSVKIGVRLERTDKDFDRTNELTTQSMKGERVNNFVLPKLAVTYAWTPHMTSTATLSEATRPGGWSAYTDRPQLAPFPLERATQLEVATQTRSQDDHWSLAGRAFAYLIHDLQIERSFNAQDYLVVNAPRARSFGEELELTWHPVSSWRFTAALGATQATLTDYHDPFSQVSYDGNRVPYTPAYTADLAADYQHAGWFAGAELASTGQTDFEESENPRYSQAAHSTVNARAGYQTGHWRLTGYADNLTEERYYSLIIPAVNHATPGAPRTFGLELAAKIR